MRKIIEKTGEILLQKTKQLTEKLAQRKVGEKINNISSSAYEGVTTYSKSIWGFLNTQLGSNLASAILTGWITYKTTKAYREEYIKSLVEQNTNLGQDINCSSRLINKLITKLSIQTSSFAEQNEKLRNQLISQINENNMLAKQELAQVTTFMAKNEELRSKVTVQTDDLVRLYAKLNQCNRDFSLARSETNGYKLAYNNSYCFYRKKPKEYIVDSGCYQDSGYYDKEEKCPVKA